MNLVTRRILAVLLVWICCADLLAQSKPVAVGQVSNLATKDFLEGVNVHVVETGQETHTDREGRYRVELPSEGGTLTFSYAGLDSQSVPVVPSQSGAVVVNIDLTSEAYKLDKFVVTSEREGTAYANTRQRLAASVRDVVSSDGFGNVADGNIGNFIQQLPGIVADYNGPDVLSVSIRGIASDLNSVTFDGDRVASSPAAGLGRSFQFEQSSLNMIETIEVIKAPTPDMDADAIGGTVNLISKSPFDRKAKRMVSYSIAGVYRPKYYTRSPNWIDEPLFPNVGPSLHFTYADRFGKKQNLGIMVNAIYHAQPGGDTASVLGFQATLADPYYATSVSIPRPAGSPTVRTSAGIKLDYKLSEHTTLSLNTNYNWYHANNDTRGMQLSTTASAANFVPGYTSFYQEVLPNANSRSTISQTTNDKSGDTILFAPSVKHKWNTLEIDYQASYSISNTYYDYLKDNRKYDDHLKSVVSLNVRNIGWTLDRTDSWEWPEITQTSGADIYNLASYSNLTVNDQTRRGRDDLLSTKFNLKKTFEWRIPTALKVGANWREQNRSLERFDRRYTYQGTNIQQFLYTGKRWTDSNEGYRQPPWVDNDRISQHVVDNPSLWTEDTAFALNQRLLNDRKIKENVTGAYAMATFQPLRNFQVLAGVRMEKTETEAEGPIQVGTTISGRQRTYGSYTDTFPGIHLRYEPWKRFIVRGSYSTSIGRPSFDALIPLDTVSESARRITTRNPGLRPQFADNFDLGVGYYLNPVGLISVSAFLKEIEDFQFTALDGFVPGGSDNGYNGLYEGYEIVRPQNGGRARYRGLELSYNQRFSFLPGWLKGFGATASFTYLETRGDYGGTVATSRLANFVPKSANAGINYIANKWSIYLNATWRDEFLVNVSSNAASETYEKARMQMTLKTNYQFSPLFGVFCDVENINSAPISDRFIGREDRVTLYRIMPPKIVAGIRGRF
jgi:iron complex outermembrane recepter protein